MKNKLERYFPVGIDYMQELKWTGGGFLLSLLYSLTFLIALWDGYYNLFDTSAAGKKVLLAGAVMPDFADLLGGKLIGFLIVAVCMAPLFVYHYSYHYQDSRSIYLMRRLPERWELAKRCAVMPLLTAVSCLLAASLLLLFYYELYMLVTPEPCLTPGQWNKIWIV